MLENIFLNIIETSLPVSVLIMVLLLLNPLIQKSYIAKWRYFMWLFIAIRLIIPINIKIPQTPIQIQVPQLFEGQGIIQQTTTDIDTITALHQNISEPMNIIQILSLVWVMGIIVFIFWQGIQYWHFKKAVSRWVDNITDDRIIQAFCAACIQMNVIQDIEIKLCKKVSTPMIIGFFNPMLLLPSQQFSDKDLTIIFKHELIHFRRHDLWYKLLLLITNSLHWFNPIVYYMIYTANKDIELVCDEEVVEGMDLQYKKHYCQTILSIVHNYELRRTTLSTCFKHGKKSTLERLSNILNLKIKKTGALMFLSVSLSIVISGSLISFTSAQVAAEMIENIVIPQKNTYDIPEEDLTNKNNPAQSHVDMDEIIKVEDAKNAVREIIPETYAKDETNTIPVAPKPPDADQTNIISETSKPPEIIKNQETEHVEKPIADKKSNIITIPASSYSFEANFKEKGQSTTISKVFQPENDMNMTINKTNSGGLVQVVNANTGEIVFDEATVASDTQLNIPINEGKTYKINVSSTKDNDTVKLYIYGINMPQ